MTVAALYLIGCAGTQLSASTGCGTRPTFYGYYQCGLEHEDHGEWAKAVTDFKIAIGEIEGSQYGRAKDSKTVKTYGMHFEKDYYPNREIGVCLYQIAVEQGDRALLKQAESYLKGSLASAPTPKCQSYLKKVKQLLEGEI